MKPICKIASGIVLNVPDSDITHPYLQYHDVVLFYNNKEIRLFSLPVRRVKRLLNTESWIVVNL